MSIPEQQQQVPGTDQAMDPKPDYGEGSYRGSGRLTGKVALLTGADSGIGKAVALAFAREGADVAVVYLSEHTDAQETARFIEEAGRTSLLIPTDLADPDNCREAVRQTVEQFGRIDVLVHNAAYQMTRETLDEIPDDEWDHTLAVNLSAYFHLVKAAVPQMPSGASIIATSSVQADTPTPELLPYAVTKAGIANMTASLAQMLADKGIRANAVAPGPVWTPLIPSTMPPEKVEDFGTQVPLGRAGQPAELAPVYVMLASDEASYISGAVIPVTGGKPFL
ncbi:SDR family oxidoreductase [Naasia lichenicola]|uniref:SDR family oxidoreductase n=1 Tax=Naasia lichenicola TaxID=2565933 RepID=A0A4S4FJB1_9MICO|nr:SDR family oxidoreductase [Naasia lichenicola]THG29994.1 SDR family oxidoreductase [Naasia lichenicola]